MNRFLRSAVFAIGLSLALHSPAIASPGDLDLTFSGDGKLTDMITGTMYNSLAATVIQPDGKIVTAGGVSEPRFIYVARYNPDGSPDLDFGSGTGKVQIQFGPYYNLIYDIALQPDGRIVIAGCYCEEDFGDYALALARLNSNGSLDTSFGPGGIVTQRQIRSPATSMAIHSDGKIVTAGFAGFNSEALVARFNADGSLDTSFNGSGYVHTPNVPSFTSIAVQADGKIVGATTDYDGLFSDFVLVRYNSNGDIDTTFDDDGIVITEVNTNDEFIFLTIQSDWKIVAAGGVRGYFAIARYNADGSLDTSFGGAGLVFTQFDDGHATASSVAIQHDGKVIAAGTRYSGGPDDFALARYLPDGSPDISFGGGDGKVVIDFDESFDSAADLALDNDGRAVVVGSSDEKFAIARLHLASKSAFDFDGDSRSDISVFRPSDSIWYLDRSSEGFAAAQFGISSDKITPADYDGDGKTDIAVYRGGTWYWLASSNGSFHSAQFGLPDDLPIPADYTADGRDELAIYRSGQWWTFDLSNGDAALTNFGLATDKTVPADYDGDGRVDQAVYRDGVWHLNRSRLGYTGIQFGLAADRPVPADYDGDGKADIAVFREGIWYLLQSANGFAALQWGLAADIPVPADFDGDGKTDLAVYRNGTWYLLQSTGGFSAVQFGAAGDKPVPSAFLP